MLWRLECRDVDVGDRWEELADACAGKIDDHALAFTEPHHVMALGRAGRFDEVERVFESLEACARERTTWAASIARRLTLPLCRAVAACCRGDYDEAPSSSSRSARTTRSSARVTPSATCSRRC